MAKIAFSKLGLKKIEDIKIANFNDIEIEVKQYLPITDKLTLVANVLNNSADDNNFANPVKVDVFTTLEIIYAYTNLTFTDKQKKDPAKLFDLLETNGLIAAIMRVIPEDEYNFLLDAIDSTVEAFYKYRNSVLGILDTISADYSKLSLDAANLQQQMANPENLELLKGIMSKLG